MSHAMNYQQAVATVEQVKLTGRLSLTVNQSGENPWFNDERTIEQFEADARQINAILTGERTFTRIGSNLTISQEVANARS